MHGMAHPVNVNVNKHNLPDMSEQDFENSGEPGPQAKGVNHLRPLIYTHRASSCAKHSGHVQLCFKARGTHGIESETREKMKRSAFMLSSDRWT